MTIKMSQAMAIVSMTMVNLGLKVQSLKTTLIVVEGGKVRIIEIDEV